MAAQRWLTRAEAADALKVGVPTVDQLIERGDLAAEMRDGEPQIAEQALLAFLRAEQQAIESPPRDE
ncbi:MAG TPA: helix-turn-helix domain-containing protein [Roseiflexaceae bacterium]|nr:helix-turn-helix domain-containing protein [Roseiflexaceae bacterium]